MTEGSWAVSEQRFPSATRSLYGGKAPRGGPDLAGVALNSQLKDERGGKKVMKS